MKSGNLLRKFNNRSIKSEGSPFHRDRRAFCVYCSLVTVTIGHESPADDDVTVMFDCFSRHVVDRVPVAASRFAFQLYQVDGGEKVPPRFLGVVEVADESRFGDPSAILSV